jgi:hypothetical protein
VPQKQVKTAAELEALIMDELNGQPECVLFECVILVRPVGRGNWDVALVGDHSVVSADCVKKISEIAARLSAQYNLAEREQIGTR